MMDKKAKKILLLGAGFTTRNMGVWALASGAITSAINAYPDAEIYLLDYHEKPSKYEVKHPNGSVDVELINIRFSKKLWLSNNIFLLTFMALLIKIVPLKILRRRLIPKNYCLNHIDTSDVIGSIAGGDSFSDIYGIERFIYVTLPQILILLLGKPLIILPQTIGPFKGTIAKKIAAYILNHAGSVYARDHESLAEIKTICRKREISFCYDMGFVLEPHIAEERMNYLCPEVDHERPLIGLNVSGLLYIGGYSGNNMFALKGDYRILIHDIIDYFIHKYKAHILLVPHVVGSSDNLESDITACYKIFEESDEDVRRCLHILDESFNHHEIKAIIGQSDFFIGSRMHACIAALSQCIAAVGLSYSRKFQGVYATIGMEELIVDLKEMNGKIAIKLIDNAYQRRGELQTQLQSVMPIVKHGVMSLFEYYRKSEDDRKSSVYIRR